jgi:hypothetical protein
LRGDLVESKIQRQNGHSRLAEEAELPPARVVSDEAPHGFLADAALAGHARDLEIGVRLTDMRIEPAS